MDWLDFVGAYRENRMDSSVEIYRRSCRVHSYATPHGDGSYDAFGTLLMSNTEPYPDAIGADEIFYTCVACDVVLESQHFLNAKPSMQFSLKDLFKKKVDCEVQWSIKTDLPVQKERGICEILTEQNRACVKQITIRLVPKENSYLHRLIVSTKIIPDNLDNFCLVKDFYPFEEGTKMGSDYDAGVLMLDTMVKCCRGMADVLQNDCLTVGNSDYA